jgi:hypothetical protein
LLKNAVVGDVAMIEKFDDPNLPAYLSWLSAEESEQLSILLPPVSKSGIINLAGATVKEDPLWQLILSQEEFQGAMYLPSFDEMMDR